MHRAVMATVPANPQPSTRNLSDAPAPFFEENHIMKNSGNAAEHSLSWCAGVPPEPRSVPKPVFTSGSCTGVDFRHRDRRGWTERGCEMLGACCIEGWEQNAPRSSCRFSL